MILDADVQACAATVETGDPDRFRTVMAAPVAARAILFPLYAFNVEVSRAPWVTQEPMIAEMRLQWWRDALDEIAQGSHVRKHQVTTPLSALITPEQIGQLDQLIAMRRWDIYKDAFEDQEHFDTYINNTAGTLMWAAAQLLGAPAEAEATVRGVGYAAGIAAFLCAVPSLVEAGRIPLIDGTRDGLITLARRGLDGVAQPGLSKKASPALWPAIGTVAALKKVIRDPDSVGDGRLQCRIAPWRLTRAAMGGKSF